MWVDEHTYVYSWLESILMKILLCGRIPYHVAFIMDGNRRFSALKNLPSLHGHRCGSERLAVALQWCKDLGVREVTVFAFGIENFGRSKEEVDGLFDLALERLRELLTDGRETFRESKVQIRILGNIKLLPFDLQKAIKEVVEMNKNCKTDRILNIALAYSGREEMIQAVRLAALAVKEGIITSDEIDTQLFQEGLYTRSSRPPDLLIRTSGEVRFSNFLLWQCSFSTTFFASVLWPAFSLIDFLAAIFAFQLHHLYTNNETVVDNDATPTPKSHLQRFQEWLNSHDQKRLT